MNNISVLNKAEVPKEIKWNGLKPNIPPKIKYDYEKQNKMSEFNNNIASLALSNNILMDDILVNWITD